MKVEGGCHCKAVRFEAEVPEAVEILDCNCSVCSATGFRHLIVPHGDFRLLSGEEPGKSRRTTLTANWKTGVIPFTLPIIPSPLPIDFRTPAPKTRPPPIGFDLLRVPLVGRFLKWRHARLAMQIPLAILPPS